MTPIQYAAEGAQLLALKGLLQLGFDVNVVTNVTPTPSLCLACDCTDSELALGMVEVLIAHGANVNAQSEDGYTPLMIAKEHRDNEVIRILFEYGANEKCPEEGIDDCYKQDHLLSAVREGDGHRVWELFKKGADINLREHRPTPFLVSPVNQFCDTSKTPLCIAVKSGNANMVRQLCYLGATVPNVFGMKHIIYPRRCIRESECSPLYIAVEKGDIEVVRILYSYDVNINTDPGGYLALETAVDMGKRELIRELLKHGVDVNNGTCLNLAVSEGNVNVVRELLMVGADVNKEDNGRTLLTLAADHCHAKIVRELCAHGADVNKHYKGRTPLYIAANQCYAKLVRYLLELEEYCDVEIVRALCEYGADVNKDYNGRTPLYSAAENGHELIVRELCALGADLNKDCDGRTPLYAAAKNGHELMVRELCALGADLNKDCDGRTPLYAAAKNGHELIVRELCALGADLNKDCDGRTPLYVAAKNGHELIVSELCKLGADVNKDCDGRTPLYVAAKNGHELMVRELCKLGADVNRGGNNGETPLSIAAMNAHAEVVFFLLSRGADINRGTPLVSAMKNKKTGNSPMIYLLCRHGADLNQTNSRGLTPMICALKQLDAGPNLLLSPSPEKSLENVRQLLLYGVSADVPSNSSLPKSFILTSLLKDMKQYLRRVGYTRRSERVENEAKKNCLALYCRCLELLLSASCQVEHEHYQLMNSKVLCPILTTEGVLEYAHRLLHYDKPITLKRLCKLALRREARRSLKLYLPATGLPKLLQKYVLLEIPD